MDSATGDVALSPNGAQLYVIGEDQISHLALNPLGTPTFIGCLGDLEGCTANGASGELDEAGQGVVSPDGTHLYVNSYEGSNLSWFTLDPAGNPTFAGCIGDLSGCTPTNPAQALDHAVGAAMSANGKQLYVVGQRYGALNHFSLQANGTPAFDGCLSDVLVGCTPTPAATHALDDPTAAIISPGGTQLYVAGENSLDHFALDASGNPTFAACIGAIPGCTVNSFGEAASTRPLAISPDERQLYTTSGDDVAHYSLNGAGDPTYIGCVGDGAIPGCSIPKPPDALEEVADAIVSPDGSQLYTVSGGALSRFTLGAAGNPTFLGCVGDEETPGCTPPPPLSMLEGVSGLSISADGLQLYAAAGGPTDGLDHFTVGPAPPPPPTASNSFRLGKVVLNERRGTARLAVTVPGKGVIFEFIGSQITQSLAQHAGNVSLTVSAGGRAVKQLKHRHRVTIDARVMYTPVGGSPLTKRKRIHLVERR